MERTDVIQAFIDGRGLSSYLEIGIRSGHTFLRVRAPRKTAVEPAPIISLFKKLRWRFRNPSNRGNTIFEMTSDDFFAQHAGRLERGGLDIAFVDGLHTYEQSLRDVENCLRFLNDGGVVLMHDCSPSSEEAAVSLAKLEEMRQTGLAGETDMWCGDVFKTVLHLRAMRPDVTVLVLDCDHGIGVVQRGPAGDTLDLTPEEIASITYQELDEHRREWLNLTDPARLDEVVRTPPGA
jgi:hypothetical protein